LKTAIVTGGAVGIGKGIVESLLTEQYKVLVLDNNINELKKFHENLDECSSNNYYYKNINLQNFTELYQLLDLIKNNYSDVSLLVNNAGIYPSKSMFEISENDWDEVHGLNLKSLFFISQGISEVMIKNNEINCNIINITSTASEVARYGTAHYASSKAGLKMLTQVMALELADYNIRVNSIGPGLVETNNLMNSLDHDTAIKEHQEKIGYYPLNRPANVEEIANVVQFIASEKASFVNGQNILVDGGYSAGKIYRSFSK